MIDLERAQQDYLKRQQELALLRMQRDNLCREFSEFLQKRAQRKDTQWVCARADLTREHAMSSSE